MNIDDLLKAVDEWKSPTPEGIGRLKERLRLAELRFIDEFNKKRITQAFLNKEYTL